MHSSTSSSDPPPVQPLVLRHGDVAALEVHERPPYQRPVPMLRFGVAGAVALAVFVTGMVAWEGYWRGQGAVPGARSSAELWAAERRRIDAGEGDATVLIGSSRMLSNLQLPVWERLSGRRPIQLSIEGTSPMAALEDLAADTAFRGRLMVGVTPDIFFTGFAYRGELITGWRDVTPSQRAGQVLSQRLLEPWLAFLDPDFALMSVVERAGWPEREAPKFRRPVPKIFISADDRNTRLWARVERDTAYRDLVRSIWLRGDPPPPVPGSPEDSTRATNIERETARAVAAVAKLRARGVEVIFVRHPSSGTVLEHERGSMPRAISWDSLLARTGARGIHSEDHPSLSSYDPPEWSHLTGADADRFTEALYRVVAEGAPTR